MTVFGPPHPSPRSFPGGSVVKNLPANAGDLCSIPGFGRSSGEGNGNPLQHSCLENSMNRRAWWATIHRVIKSRIQVKQLSIPAHFPGSRKTPGDPISTFPRKGEDPKGINMRTSTPEPPQSASESTAQVTDKCTQTEVRMDRWDEPSTRAPSTDPSTAAGARDPAVQSLSFI